jgi:hypothetical protein
MSKIILHLCADIGSDSKPYQDSPDYTVIKIGKDVGVENYTPPKDVYGVIANPVCLEFTTARTGGKSRDLEAGMFLVRHCQRIIEQCNPAFWVIENPAKGDLKKFLGEPRYKYQPWWFGSPWTKETALWGEFNIPERIFNKWEDVPKNEKLYVRTSGNRKGNKPPMYQFHKSAIEHIPEFHCFKELVKDDMSMRSLCSQGFAQAFFKVNK